MKRQLFFWFFFPLIILAQTQLINNNHIIYNYLEYLHTSGNISEYNGLILPLSKKQLIEVILQNKIGNANNYSFEYAKNLNNSVFDSISVLTGSFYEIYEKNIISYSDSTLNFGINPILELKSIIIKNKSAVLVNYGGKIALEYGKNFTALLEAYNGYIGGEIEVAKSDKRVSNSFSVNNTKIKYFDGTRGYINYETNNLKLFLGRNELIWGVSVLNPLVLGNRSQDMDFIKFEFNYKKLNYTFLHGWLVNKRESYYIDSLIGDVHRKSSKYIAINRIGYNPNDKLKLGIFQSVIYANRPVELAYLNPFLLWESAQRSQNDLDNSFLGIDITYLPISGAKLFGNLIFDDINFDLWGKGSWNTPDNRIA